MRATITSLSLCLFALAFPGESRSATVDIDIIGFVFSPSSVTIQVGDTVRWTQRDTTIHTTTSGTTTGGVRHPDGLWDSGNMNRGQTFSHTFTVPGAYPYYCTPHFSFMTGVVIVEGANNAPPTVSLLSPTNGAMFTAQDNILIEATATDADDEVAQVELLDGTISLGVFAASPYRTNLVLAPGNHSLTAVAMDSRGATGTSPVVTISVHAEPITDPIPEHIPKGDITIELQTVASGLASPLGLVIPDDGSKRLWVYDQVGLIWEVTPGGKAAKPLLDIRNRLVPLEVYDERGLLGVAAHPQFAQHPLIYTYTSEPIAGPADFPAMMPAGTSANHQSVIAEWRMDPLHTNQIDLGSRRELLRVDKPQANHNGGALHFGADGFLYFSIGDGGNANDVGDGHMPGGNAQNLTMILGKLLRIDVDGTNAANGKYGIPADNPFVGQDAVQEIYAYGLRNPFSFSFDRDNQQLYLGDVGQNKIEEIDVITRGGNYGWNIKEGTFWFDAASGNVVTAPVRSVPPGLIDPIAEYDHDEGSTVIGGYVYRGSAFPALQGRYVFGDWGAFGAPSGKLLYFDEKQTIKQLRIGFIGRPLGSWIKGFGRDADGELYVFGSRLLGPSGDTGQVLKLVPVPAALTVAGYREEGEQNPIFSSQWVGGMGPFAVQRKASLADPTWNVVAITTNRDIDVAIRNHSEFYRLADIAHQLPIPLTTYLTGASERPEPVTPSGSGFGIFSLDGNTLRFNIHYDGLSSSAIGAHFHGPATTATSADVLLDLSPYIAGNPGSQGQFSGVLVLSDTQLVMVLGGQTYVNIHTANHPGGEIRGQVVPVLMEVELNGANERPDPLPLDVRGSGLGIALLVGNQLTFDLSYQGLSGIANGAHLHGPANDSQSAPALMSLAPFSGHGFGSQGSLAGTQTLTPEELAAVIDGLTYVNIHTGAHPDGEVRGQLLPQPAGVPLSVFLSGAAEKPLPVTTDGQGQGLFSLEGNTLEFSLTYHNLTSPATAAHIHGPASTADTASVLVSLIPYSIGPWGTNGTISGTVILTPAQAELVMAGRTYLNLHTEMNPSGEIRGQIAPVLMVSSLSGVQERPTSSATTGSGSGTFALVGNQLTFDLTYQNLFSAAVASHIHGPASLFQTADVLMDLGSFNGGAWGNAGSLVGTVTLGETNLAQVIDGHTYVNVHSPTYPAGEIRGQITR